MNFAVKFKQKHSHTLHGHYSLLPFQLQTDSVSHAGLLAWRDHEILGIIFNHGSIHAHETKGFVDSRFNLHGEKLKHPIPSPYKERTNGCEKLIHFPLKDPVPLLQTMKAHHPTGAELWSTGFGRPKPLH